MADYAALLNAEKKKTSPTPMKDVRQVQKPQVSPAPQPVETEKHPVPKVEAKPEIQKPQPISPASTSASTIESKQSSDLASKQASMLATNQEIIEAIRKVVKTPAKEEVLYIRVSKEEKHQLGDIEYTYKRQDIETSANELGRIAINFLIADYKANGENSILAKLLTRLHA